MNKFKLSKLSDLVDRVKVGFVGPINEFYCDQRDGIPLIRTTDISDLGIDYSNLKYVTKEFHEKNRKSQIKNGDLIIARHGENGKANIFKENFEAQVLNAVIIEPNSKKFDSNLLKIFFDSPFVKRQILGVVKGSVQGVINTAHVANLLLPISEEIDYSKLTKLIGDLDSKISLNNRINAELEAMAKTIYDYWFVQFDFPNKTGKPYKASGGKMVWSEELKREIPEGWEVAPLKSLVTLVKGNVSPNEIDQETPYVGLEHIPRKSIILSEWELADKVDSDKCKFQKHDVLFGKIRPYFHKVAIALTNGITSTDTIVLRSKQNNLVGFSLQTVFTEKFVEAATKSSTGSKMPRADWNVLKDYIIPLPDNSLLNRYQDLFKDCVKKIEINVLENRKLSELRDWLVPMLMNGQIKIKDAEGELAMAAEAGVEYKTKKKQRA